MSKTIDQRVVEMRFDNADFEKNVQTSIKSLDNLKKHIDTDTSTEGLSSLDTGLQKIKASISSLDMLKFSFLDRLADKAMDAGERLVKSLSIDQIAAGYKKYETETANVQTLMNSTGKSVDEINRYLEKLMWFSDETSYGFTDMTSALSSMVASGGDIDKLIPMIEGMATATAFAGKGATEFSRVIYNLNQSYGQGYLSLIDWKSVEQAGVGTSKQLKETIIETAKEVGTLNSEYKTAKGTLVDIGSFSQTLSEKWATSEVLEKAFTKFSKYATAVQEEAIRTGEPASVVMARLKDNYDDLSVKAFEAAQSAKSFTEAIDATKDAVSSQWNRIFKVIFGDYETIKDKATELTEDLWSIFAEPLGGAVEMAKEIFYSPWEKIKDEFIKMDVPVEDFKETIISVGKASGKLTDDMIKDAGSFEKTLESGWLTESLMTEAFNKYIGSAGLANDVTKELGNTVNKVIRGDFGNGEVRVKKLTDAGYSYAEVQDLVNKSLGINAGILAKGSDELLKRKGYTSSQIEMLKALREESKKTGTSMNDIISSMDKKGGRDLLFDSLHNVLNMVNGIVKAASEGIKLFTGNDIYTILTNINTFTESLKLVDDETGELNENGKKLIDVFEGISAVLGLIYDIVSIPLKIAFQVLGDVFGVVSGSVLDIGSNLGKSMKEFKDWIDQSGVFKTVISVISSVLSTIIKKIISFIKWIKEGLIYLYEIPEIKSFVDGLVDGIKNFGKTIQTAFAGASKSASTFKDKAGKAISEFVSQLKNGTKKIKDFPEWFKNTFLKLFDFKSISFGSLTSKFSGAASNIEDTVKKASDNVFGMFGETGNKIKDVVTNVYNFIKDIVVKSYNAISGFISDSKGEIFAFAGLIGTIFVAKKFFDIFTFVDDIKANFTSAITSLTKGFTGFLGALTKDKKAEALLKKSEAILNFAKAIGILVLALIALTTIVDYSKIKEGAIVLGSLIGALLAVYVVMALLEKFAGGGKGASLSVGQIITSFATIVIAVKELAQVDALAAWNAALVISELLAALVGATILLSRFSKDSLKQALVVVGIGLSLKLICSALKSVAEMDLGQLTVGVLVLELLFKRLIQTIIAMGVAGKISEKNKSSMFSILATAAGIYLIVKAIKVIGNMDPEKLALGLGVVEGLFIILLHVYAAIAAIGKYLGGGGSGDPSKILLSMSASLILCAIAIRILGGMSPAELTKGTAAVAAMYAIFTGVILLLSKFQNNDIKNVNMTLLSMTAAILICTGAIWVLGHLDKSQIAKGIAAIAGISGLFMALIAVSKGATDAKNTIVAMTVAIAVMTLALVALSFIDGKKLVVSALSLGLVIAAFALLIFSVSSLGDKQAKNTIKILSIMLLVTLAIAAMVVALSFIPTQGVLSITLGISAIMLSMAALMFILSKIDEAGLVRATVATGLIVVLLLAIGAVLLGLALLTNPDEVLPIAIAIAGLAVVLTGCLVVLALVGALIIPAMYGILGLLALTAVLTLLIIAFGAMASSPEITDLIDKGIPLLVKVAGGIGEAIGAFISALATGVMDIIPAIGAKFSEFWENFKPFVEGVKTIDSAVFESVLMLVAIIIAVTAAEIINTLASFLTGGSGGLVGFGKLMVEFAPLLVLFGKIISTGLTPGDIVMMHLAASATQAFVDIANRLPRSGGFLQKIIGENEKLNDFGFMMIEFVPCLILFSELIKAVGFCQDDVDRIELAATATGYICDVANKVPKRGGWVGAITGENSLAGFGLEMALFAPNLVTFSKEINEYGFDKAKVDSIEAACTAAGYVCELADKVPKRGGFVAAITGENSLAGFGEELAAFAPAFVTYVTTALVAQPFFGMVKKMNSVVLDTIKLANSLPSSGGALQWLIGEHSLAGFGEELAKFGPNFVKYATTIGKIPEDSVDKATSVSDILTKFTNLFNAVSKMGVDLDDTGIDDFGSDIEDFADDFLDGMEDISERWNVLYMPGTIESVLKWCTALNDFSKEINKDAASNFKKFTEGIVNLSKFSTEDFAAKFASPEINLNVQAAIDNFYKQLETVLGKDSIKFISKFEDLASTLLDKFETKFTTGSTKTAENSVKGLANGFSSFSKDVQNIGIQIANDLQKGIRSKKGLSENSPSKKMYQIGAFAAEGLVNGLESYGNKIYDVGVEMGKDASGGLSDAISIIRDSFDGQISDQPVIRPVLDLSDVRNGARYINGMFNDSNVIALSTNGSIGNQNRYAMPMINITVNGAPGQDVNELADIVSAKLNTAIQRRNSVWR